MTEIEQLRADIATLEAAIEMYDRKSVASPVGLNRDVKELKRQPADLIEKSSVDPWSEAKGAMFAWEKDRRWPNEWYNLQIYKYVRHLESRITELDQKLAKRPVAWCVRSNISGNFYRLYDEPALFATANQARKCPGVPKEWIVESYTGEQE